jgi:uncharacterized Zn finger protein
MYGIGARLDERPDLLFVLRGVDHMELIRDAAANVGKVSTEAQTSTLEGGDLSEIFGIAIDDSPAKPATVATRATAASAKRKPSSRKTELRSSHAESAPRASSPTKATARRR